MSNFVTRYPAASLLVGGSVLALVAFGVYAADEGREPGGALASPVPSTVTATVMVPQSTQYITMTPQVPNVTHAPLVTRTVTPTAAPTVEQVSAPTAEPTSGEPVETETVTAPAPAPKTVTVTATPAAPTVVVTPVAKTQVRVTRKAPPPAPERTPSSRQTLTNPPPATPPSPHLAMPAMTADQSAVVARIVERVNAARAAHGVAPLRLDGEVTAASQQWSDHMASTLSMSHRPDPGSVMPVPWTRASENVGWTSPGSPVAAADRIVNAWMASSGHRHNILDPGLKATGVGASRASDGSWYATQDFKAP